MSKVLNKLNCKLPAKNDQRCLANCYNEVLETLKFLKPSNNKHYQNDDEDLAPEQNDYKNLIEAVAEGDDRLNENYKLWKKLQQERIEVEQELRKILSESSLTWERNSVVFMDVDEVVTTENNSSDANAENKSAKSSSKQTDQLSYNKDFIARNIELAKNGAMATFSLTDEEKSKLETLLSDIDDDEHNQKGVTADLDQSEHERIEDEFEELMSNHVNEFKLTPEDRQRIAELEAKMEEVLDAFPEQLRNKTENRKTGERVEDPLKDVDETGRLWKYAELDERMKDIDRQLESMSSHELETCEKESEEKCDETKPE